MVELAALFHEFVQAAGVDAVLLSAQAVDAEAMFRLVQNYRFSSVFRDTELHVKGEPSMMVAILLARTPVAQLVQLRLQLPVTKVAQAAPADLSPTTQA